MKKLYWKVDKEHIKLINKIFNIGLGHNRIRSIYR